MKTSLFSQNQIFATIFVLKTQYQKHLKSLLTAFLLLLSVFGWGQIITFDFAGLAGSETSATSNFNNTNLTTSTISRGAGITASANADRFNATNWAVTSIANAVTGNDYMEFTITPNSGYQFDVSSIVVQWQRSNTGNTQIALRSSVDGYVANLDAVKSVVDNALTQSFTFTFAQANSTSAVTYRLYSYAEATTGTGGPGDGTGNDIVVNGTVTSTVADTTPPTLSTLNPVNTATGVAINSNLVATFSENIVKGTGNILIKRYDDNTTAQTIDVTNAAVSISGATATINPADFLNSTQYYVEIDAGAFEDVAGNDFTGITGNTIWSFTTDAPVTPSITSALTKSTVYGTADTYNIIASGSPISFNATGLPTGLSVNTTTGEIFGTPTSNVGSYNVSISATNGGGTDTKTLVWTITQRPLTISGLVASNKVYDGNTTATLTGTAVLNGVVGSDDVSLTGTAAGTFADKNVGTGKTVSITGLSLAGTKEGNYSLPTTNATTTADITLTPLSITAPTIASKVYNGSAVSGAVTVGTLSGFVGTETVTATATGLYADANAAIGKTATVTYVLANGANGGLATNYSLAAGTGVGDITKENPTFSPLTISLSVGGTQTILSDSDGVLSFTSDNAAIATVGATTGLVTGVAAGSTIINVSQAESTNYFAKSTTVGVNVTSISFGYNSFLSITGSGSYTTQSTWSKCGNLGGCTGTTAGSGGWSAYDGNGTPSSTATVFIQGTITNTASNGAANVTILEGGNLIISNNYPVSTSFTVKTGGKFTTNYGAVFTPATGVPFIVEDGADVYINTAFTGVSSSLWKGEENFYPQSNLYINNWRTGSSPQYLVNDNVTINTHNGYSAMFGNIYIDPKIAPANNAEVTAYNNTGFGGGNWDMLGPLNVSPINLTHGDLVFVKTPINIAGSCSCGSGSGAVRTPRIMGNESGTFVVNVKGNLKLNSTYTNTAVVANKGNFTLNVGGNVENDSPGTLSVRSSTAPGNTILNIVGNLLMNGSGTTASTKLYMNQNNYGTANGNKAIINLSGDLSIGANSAILSSAPTADTEFNFAGTGNGLTDETTQTINVVNQATANDISFNVNSGSYTKLINQNLALGASSIFNVKDGGTLDFGFNGINGSGSTALNITNHVNSAVFKTEANSILKITSPAGVTSTVNLGNVQTTSTTRTYDPGATYHYIGKADQATGNGLPDGLTNKVIVDLQTDATNENLNFTANGLIKFNSSGILEIRRGKVFDIPNYGFRNNVVENEDGESDAQKGNIEMSGGRYVVSGSGTKPSLSGTYDLSAGTVEFTGTAATKIRTSSSPVKLYYNVDVSGTNVETGGKNFIVNNLLKVTTANAVLTIPEEIDTANPYVVTAKKGIQVVAGGKAIFKNNANLMQDADAVNSGSVQAERKTSMKKMDYTYWSSPVQGTATSGQRLLNTTNPNLETSSGGFSETTPNTRIFRYNEPNDYFVATTDSYFIPGKGYAIRGKNGYGTTKTPDTFSFTGTPNNGDAITVDVQRSPATTSGANTYQHGYNLIGNPYPSGLNFYNFFDQNQTKITGKAWFWSNAYDTLNQTGSVNYLVNNYAVLTLLGGSPPTYGGVEGPIGYTPTENIKLGQGFIIQVRPELTSTQPVLTFANTMRTTGVGTFFNNFKNQPESKNRYWVKFVSPDNVVNTILLGYVAQATDDYDVDYDAELFTVGDDSFYSLLGTRKMQIQAKGEFVQDSKIDIGSKQSKDGNYTIRLDQPEGVFGNGQAIYLHDKLNDTYTNLLEQNYTFSAIKGATENRFEIVYKLGSTLGTNASVKNNLQVYRNGEYFIVKSTNKKIDEVEVYDASGRLFQNLQGNTTEIMIDASSISSGMYILKIKRNNEIISKKIIK